MSGRGKKKNKQRSRTKAHQVRLAAPATARTDEETPEDETSPTPMRWAADDPEATWWDDVWPFHVESGADVSAPEEPESEELESEELESEELESEELESEEPEAEEPEAEEPTPSVEPGRADAQDVPGLEEEPPLLPGLWIAPGLPDPESGEGRERRRRRVVVGAALVAAVAIVAVAAWVETRSGPAPETVRLTHADQYAAPTALAPDTSYVRTRIRPSGALEVRHWIHTAQPVDAIHLRTPDVPGLSPSDVYVLQVVVAADGVPVPVTKSVRAQGVTTIQIPPARQVFLRYRLAGVLQYAGTTGVSDGGGQRALARITALDVTTSRPLVHTTRSVTGVAVLALACAPPKQPVPVPCGTERSGTWNATLGPDQQSDQVLAQVDLSGGQR